MQNTTRFLQNWEHPNLDIPEIECHQQIYFPEQNPNVYDYVVKILYMVRTAIDVTGDVFVAVIVASTENQVKILKN